MANELDEMAGPVNEAGRDVNVIEKQLPVTAVSAAAARVISAPSPATV